MSPRPPKIRAGFSGRTGSLLLAALFLALTMPLLAQTPHGDTGAELLMTALRGGVPHPPGFPLQAWLDRLFIRLPFGAPAWRLALISSLAYAGTAFFIAEALRLLEASFAARALSAGAFLLFPSVWNLGVEPEVFALAFCIMAALLRQLVEFSVRPAGAAFGLRDGIALGALVGAAAGQQPITVVFAPIFLGSLARLLADRTGRARRFGGAAAAFCLLTVALYASLALLRTASPWPDWGKLDSFGSILRHALRADYGYFNLTLARSEGGSPIEAWPLFLSSLLREWNLFLVLVPLGAVALARKKSFPGLALPAAAILGGLLLARSHSAASPEVAQGLLERFQGPALLPLAVLGGLGFQWAWDRAGRLGGRTPFFVRTAAVALAVSWLAAFAARGWSATDASRDQVLEFYREGVGLLLTPDDLYVSSQDPEIMYGALLPNGAGVRFPIAAGLIYQDWYAREVVPGIDPRVKITETGGEALRVLVGSAFDAGSPIVSGDAGLLRGPGRVIQIRGLLNYARQGVTRTFSSESVDAAVKLCPVVARLRPLPAGGHPFSRALWRSFIRAYAAASQFLITDGANPEARAASQAVFDALTAGEDAGAWAGACGRLVRAWQSSASGTARGPGTQTNPE